MTHAALIDGVVLVFLVVMVSLLVSYIMAVMVSPLQRPGSQRPQQHQAGFRGWAAGAQAADLGGLEVMTHDPVPPPEASGRPLWKQAPEPPGLDG